MYKSFGPFQIDVETRRVLLAGEAVKWGDKACHLFTLLVTRSPETISKEAIFESVWQGRVVTENSLYKTIGKLRKELAPHEMEVESVFGEGYRLISHTAAAVTEGDTTTNTQKSRAWVYLGLVLLLPLIWVAHHHYQHHQMVDNMKRLQQMLAVTKQAFISQINRRNELGELLSQRFELKKEDSWEKRFYQLYDQMNEEERFLCQQTRAFTEGPLFENNQAILQLLKDNPDMVEALPLAKDLIAHLSIWLNKYHRVFDGVDRMCLLYVGVEDGAKYPSGFDEQVDQWLAEHP